MKICFKILYQWINLIAFVIEHATMLVTAFALIMLITSAITQKSTIAFEIIFVVSILYILYKKLSAYLRKKFHTDRTIEEVERAFPKWCKLPRAVYLVMAMLNVVVMISAFNLMFIANRPSAQQFENMTKFYFNNEEDIETMTCALMMLPAPLAVILNDCYEILTEVSGSMVDYIELTGEEKEAKQAIIEERVKELQSKFEKDLGTCKVNGIFATVLLVLHGFLLYPATKYNEYKEALRRCKDGTITLQI